MARFSELKRRHQMLHRFMCGLTVSCIIVIIVGGCLGGVSEYDLALRAWCVGIVMLVGEWIIIRFWSSWEFVQAANKRTISRRK